MSDRQVITAITILLEEVNNVINEINQEGAKMFREGDYERAQVLMDKGMQLDAFHRKINDLQIEWKSITEGTPSLESKPSKRKRKGEKLKKGLRTPQELFKIPLLQTLVELGGSGSPSQVEELVLPKLKPILTDHEYTLLESFSNKPRWTHRLAWTRYDLVQEGLLSPDSPRGVWEITETGRRWLADNQASWPNQ